MYQIGEFSYLCETTIKTLRHYDKIDLLKPIKTDPFTGYRYYEEEQKEVFEKIKSLQQAGFSLQEIKEILEKESVETIERKKQVLQEELSKKIDILEKLNMKNKNSITLQKNPKFKTVGLITTIKSRKDIPKVLAEVDEKLSLPLLNIMDYPIIFENFEKGYQEENILCFIGRVIPTNEYSIPHITYHWINAGLDFLGDNMSISFLHQKVETDILSTYQSMIEYASKNNIQIRGNFQEITKDNETEIYVEAYDLNIENEDLIRSNEHTLKRLKDIHEEKFIGKWLLQGEITEIPRVFDPERKHYMPDTYLNEIILHEDGTTNFKNITWKENYLLITEENITICNRMYHEEINSQEYIEILMNPKESNARPYQYYYKKIK